ncbi:hypothetical protein NDU88_004163 [Pleurodeles waltl]|uniref:Uncharacterized protein n=1 Tax=Pleurodeles waltl TaxID=8319 RepID=A0AAV7W7B3_PLEWA|nr:hypothetical protein NDU88_004163 [Pleurodeles waltl]
MRLEAAPRDGEPNSDRSLRLLEPGAVLRTPHTGAPGVGPEERGQALPAAEERRSWASSPEETGEWTSRGCGACPELTTGPDTKESPVQRGRHSEKRGRPMRAIRERGPRPEE